MNLANYAKGRGEDSDFANRTFIITHGEPELTTITFGSFLDDVKRWAGHLSAHGVKAGERVALITPKCADQLTFFYATWWIGAIALPVSETLAELEMGFILRDSEPSVILAADSMLQQVTDLSADQPVISLSQLKAPTDAEVADAPVEVHDEQTAVLIYTSGSTGMPKGVMLSHENFRINAQSSIESIQISSQDVVMSLLPYWHSFAMVVEVVISVMFGVQIAIARDKRDFTRNLDRYRPTVILLVPRIAEALMTGIRKKVAESPINVRKLFERAIHNASRIFTAGPTLDGGMLRMLTHKTFYDPMVFRKLRLRFGGRLRFFVSGGAPLDLEHQIFFKYVGIPIYQGYGLSEATPVISVNRPDCHRLGSCGPLLSWLHPDNGGDYTFRDAEGNEGKEVNGELLVRGRCLMKGYWRHRDNSAKTLAGGWLHTGDMGYVDEDGFLFLQGREGNMIVLIGGEKLHPEHVEDVLRSAELVTEAMVIGDGCKNVYVCVNVDADAVSAMSDEDLKSALREQINAKTEHLAPFQRPKDILVLPDFTIEDGTLTVTLKIRRHRIWELHGDLIRQFLRANGEELNPPGQLGLASSKIMESLGHNGESDNRQP